MKSINRAKAEKNNGVKLTIPVRTRSPLEAFKMLDAGQNVDIMKGYYESQGVEVDKDFQLMDQIDKLKALNRYREILENTNSQYQNLIKEYGESNRPKQPEGSTGQVPESRSSNPGEGKPG